MQPKRFFCCSLLCYYTWPDVCTCAALLAQNVVMLLLNAMCPWNRSCDGWKRRTSDRAFNPDPSEVQEEERRGKWLPVADVTARGPPGINSPAEGDLTREEMLDKRGGINGSWVVLRLPPLERSSKTVGLLLLRAQRSEIVGSYLKFTQGLERGCKQLWSAETFVWKGAAAEDALSKFVLRSPAGGRAELDHTYRHLLRLMNAFTVCPSTTSDLREHGWNPVCIWRVMMFRMVLHIKVIHLMRKSE